MGKNNVNKACASIPIPFKKIENYFNPLWGLPAQRVSQIFPEYWFHTDLFHLAKFHHILSNIDLEIKKSQILAAGTRVSRKAGPELTEIDSKIFGVDDVTFLTPNNTVILAHQGSTVTLSCRLTKTPNFGMVSHKFSLSLTLSLFSLKSKILTKISCWILR